MKDSCPKCSVGDDGEHWTQEGCFTALRAALERERALADGLGRALESVWGPVPGASTVDSKSIKKALTAWREARKAQDG